MRLTITGINLGDLFEQQVDVDAQGENFFTVNGTAGTLIKKIDLQALGAVVFEDLKQVRIGGAAAVAVPEPVELLLLGIGFAAVATVRRRRDHRA